MSSGAFLEFVTLCVCLFVIISGSWQEHTSRLHQIIVRVDVAVIQSSSDITNMV